MRDISPSDALRKEFGHEAQRRDEFKRRYFSELDERKGSVEEIVRMAQTGTVTLLYSARNTELNNAVALKEYLEGKAI